MSAIPATPAGSGRLTSLQFVREIVKRGANVNLRLDKSTPRFPATSSRIETPGATPFLLAADRADVPLMRLLLELGADPLLPNFSNTTPLMAAAGLGTTEPLEEAGEEVEALEAMKMLLDLGADVNAVDNNGDTRDARRRLRRLPDCGEAAGGARRRSADLEGEEQVRHDAAVHCRGYHGRLPRPDKPTIEAVTKLMLAAGLSTEGERPAIVDIYEKDARASEDDQNREALKEGKG